MPPARLSREAGSPPPPTAAARAHGARCRDSAAAQAARAAIGPGSVLAKNGKRFTVVSAGTMGGAWSAAVSRNIASMPSSWPAALSLDRPKRLGAKHLSVYLRNFGSIEQRPDHLNALADGKLTLECQTRRAIDVPSDFRERNVIISMPAVNYIDLTGR